MADQEIIQNQIPNTEPQLKDLLDLHKKDIFLSFNCHAIATVEEFFSGSQTATCKIAYKKTRFQRDSLGNYEPILVDYPVLVKAPVLIVGGGGANLTFPIAAGDIALVCFNDRDIDNWFEGLSGGAVASGRLHSFADAVIVVGLHNKANAIPGYDAARALLKYGDSKVGINGTLVLIANGTYTLNGILQDLVTNIQDLITQVAAITVTGVTTGPGTSGPPSNAALITAISTQLTATANKLAGLLE